MSLCPCCGSEFASEIEWLSDQWTVRTPHGAAVLGSPRQAHLFALLWRHRRGTAGFTGDRLLSILYADEAGGGPQIGAVRILVKRMRDVLTPIGVLLHGGWGWGDGYRISLVTPEQASAAFQRKTVHSRVLASKAAFDPVTLN